jgi:hypothetical protein
MHILNLLIGNLTMSKRIILATVLALAVGAKAVLAADEPKSEQATTTAPVTILYKDNPHVTAYEQLNP